MSKRTVTKEELERPLVPYRDALDQIVSAFSALPPEAVPLERALGLVLAEPIVAAFDVPGFDNSAMDGYAVRAADAKPGAVLRLIDDLPAGSDPQVEIGPGTAATIMTGAPLPPGADAVVPWEDTERRETEVVVLGETASLGLTEVHAHRRPRVAILSTGDELAAPGDALEPGHVYDANRSLLAAMCARAGAEIDATALIGDEPEVIAAWLRQVARHADLIVTTGGASVGEHDWIRAILEAEGDLSLWRIAIKPGKPVAFGRFEGTPVLGLPGNPGSAFVGMHGVQVVGRVLRCAQPPLIDGAANDRVALAAEVFPMSFREEHGRAGNKWRSIGNRDPTFSRQYYPDINVKKMKSVETGPTCSGLSRRRPRC